ncbi:MAG: hypothetical protein A2484_00745 [Nitrospirae bacterium RIFOXYC2_FULL_44_7]|nr:MAG: hypothetical protein A2484_00745 [Nitrospirae bacterium RIFOXYC2_FULL_44_7]
MGKMPCWIISFNLFLNTVICSLRSIATLFAGMIKIIASMNIIIFFDISASCLIFIYITLRPDVQ